MSIALKLAATCFMFAAAVLLLPRGGMLGPFFLMWVMTVLPIAFIPQWIHPKLHTHRERRTYQAWTVGFMAATWLLITAVDAVAPTVSLLVWLGTELVFVSLIVHSIQQRTRSIKAKEAEVRAAAEPLWTPDDMAFIRHLEGR